MVVGAAVAAAATGGPRVSPGAIDAPLQVPAPRAPDADAGEEVARDGDRWPVAFGGGTDTVLVFDDGHAGAVAVDLDSGVHRPLLLPQRGGDQPYRLWRLGDRVVVGWGQGIHAVAFADGIIDIQPLPDATVFLPAADPDQLWLVDHTGGGAFSATLVDASGAPLATVHPDVAGGQPLRGVPGGLAVLTEAAGIVRYDLEDASAATPFADGAAFIADATAERVVWCGHPCERLTIADADGQVVASLAGADVRLFEPEAVWLSPDGMRLAAVVWAARPDSGGLDRVLRVYQVETGAPLAHAQLSAGHVRGTWGPAGRQFFHTFTPPPDAVGNVSQQLGRWVLGGSIHRVDVDPRLTGLGTFVALPRAAIDLDELVG